MKEPKLSIPDDTPENTVKSILEIVKQECSKLNVPLQHEAGQFAYKQKLTIDATRGKCSFRMMLYWVNSVELPEYGGSIGDGFIAGTRTQGASIENLVSWDLELLSGDPRTQPLGWDPGEPIPTRPFRWGLYPSQPGRAGQHLYTNPSHVLDGALLRKLLNDSLFPAQP